MSEVARFFGKELVKKIKDAEGNDIEIKIPTLKGSDLELILKFQNSTDSVTQAKAMQELFNRVMKYNYPEVSDTDLNKIGINVIMQVMVGIGEANNLVDESQRTLAEMRDNAQRNSKVSTNQ